MATILVQVDTRNPHWRAIPLTGHLDQHFESSRSFDDSEHAVHPAHPTSVRRMFCAMAMAEPQFAQKKCGRTFDWPLRQNTEMCCNHRAACQPSSQTTQLQNAPDCVCCHRLVQLLHIKPWCRLTEFTILSVLSFILAPIPKEATSHFGSSLQVQIPRSNMADSRQLHGFRDQ